MSEPSLQRFLLQARRAVGLKGSVNLLVTASSELRSLNSRFRGRDKPTDVLSFPGDPEPDGHFAGEIAISAEIAAQNAARLGHSTGDEIRVLALHGILHLAGYDHERDNGEMARKEAHLRQELRLPSALIERSRSFENAAHPAPRRRKRGRRTA